MAGEGEEVIPNSDDAGDEEVSFLQRLTGRSAEDFEVDNDDGARASGKEEDEHRDKRIRVEGPEGDEREEGVTSIPGQQQQNDLATPSVSSIPPPYPTLPPLSISGPAPSNPAALQDLAAFLEDMIPSDSDLPLSSVGPSHHHSHTPAPIQHQERLFELVRTEGEVGCDDSGVFMSDSMDLTEDKADMTSSFVGEDGCGDGLGVNDELEFEGDDMWDGFDDTDYGSGLDLGVGSSKLPPIIAPRMENPNTNELSPAQVEEEEEHHWSEELSCDPALIARAKAFQKFSIDASISEGPVAFKSITGKRLAFSEEAIRKAKAVLEKDEPLEEVPIVVAPTQGNAEAGPSNVTRLSPSFDFPPIDLLRDVDATASREEDQHDEFGSTEHLDSDFVPPTEVSFSFVNKRRPPPTFDPEALARSAQLFNSSPDASKPTLSTITSFGGFTSGSGNAVAGPSRESMALAESRLNSPQKDIFAASSPAGEKKKAKQNFLIPIRCEQGINTRMPLESPTTTRFLRSSVEEEEGLRSPLAPRVGSAPNSPMKQQAPTPAMSSPAAAPTQEQLMAPPLRRPSSAAASFQSSQSTPNRIPAFRPPMIQTRSTPLNSTPIGRQSGFQSPFASTSKSTPLKAAPALRRLNLGMSPRPRPSSTLKFTTPFKNGVRPPNLTPVGLVDNPPKPKVATTPPSESKRKGKEIEAEPMRDSYEPVFDLAPLENRQKSREFGLNPQTLYHEDVVALGVPEEAVAMTSASAIPFTFECGRGETQAFDLLVEDGCVHLTLPWVKNHWSLIVWKLASTVRSRPDLLPTYWGWEAAVRQLKYRYEREINHAQRSAVKRIQEQDSPSTLPMVLCVSRVRWEEDPEFNYDDAKPGDVAPLVIMGLELTDGWYRIRANIDATLKSACARGKIVVGAKLTTVGAKLDSTREGTEVLDALKVSTLILSGNSTSLAPWDTTLGFTRQTYITSLDKITSTGGVTTLIDVKIDYLHPKAFTAMVDGRWETWSEEEEAVRAKEWEEGRSKKSAKLLDAQEKEGGGEWDVIVEYLQEAVQRQGAVFGGPTDESSDQEEPDEILDRLEDAPDKTAIIGRLSPDQVGSCLQLACERAAQDRRDGFEEVEQDIETAYPSRNARAFRVVRVLDARPVKTSYKRCANLTVWDLGSFEPNFLQIGRRYMISNVMPKGNWRRKDEAITLATRRDTKWQIVDSITSFDQNLPLSNGALLCSR